MPVLAKWLGFGNVTAGSGLEQTNLQAKTACAKGPDVIKYKWGKYTYDIGIYRNRQGGVENIV